MKVSWLKTLLLLFLVSTKFIGYAQNIFDKDIKPADLQPDIYLKLLKQKRVALIINHASEVGRKSLLDVVLEGGITVKRIFVPEHGFRGNEDAGAKVENTVDSATNIPIVSLYGSHKKPRPEDLADLDIVVYDLQDVGVRFYTYISTLEYCMEACAENHKQLIILDRPDPNGFYVDGPVLEKDHKSFVGMQTIPVVYGMTCGEYAQMLTGERWFANAADLDLKVIKCVNYTHSKKYQLPVAPSPNLKDMAAVYAYPSLCLFEGTPISVGRGTDKPFRQYGCPEFEGKLGYNFLPRSMVGAKNPPYADKQCYGELVAKDESAVLTEIQTGMRLKWLISAWKLYPEKDKFFNKFFEKLAGTAALQAQITHGDSENTIKVSWQEDLGAFKKIRKKYLLYADFE